MQGGQEENMGMSTMMREVQELAEKFKVEEDEQYVSPYAHLEKAAVLQEARYVVCCENLARWDDVVAV